MIDLYTQTVSSLLHLFHNRWWSVFSA